MLPLLPDLPPDELLRRARLNASEYDLPAFVDWLRTRSADVQRIARSRPPHRVYKIAETGGHCYVLGYQPATAGVGALVVVRPLGTNAAIAVPPEALLVDA